MSIAPLSTFPNTNSNINSNDSINSICYELELLLIPSFQKVDSNEDNGISISLYTFKLDKFYFLCETYSVLLKYLPDSKYYLLSNNKFLNLIFEFLLRRLKQLEKMILSERKILFLSLLFI